MADQETCESPTAKRIKQTISVPFIWEEKPGIPKPDYWKRINPIMQLPIKLIASVPFMWEQKPGTPLPIHQTNKINNPFYESETDCCQDLNQEHYQHQQYNKNNPFCDSSDDDEFEDNINGEISEYGINAPSSPAWETESSYAPTELSETSTLAGSSFLECMFPLMTSQNKPSFLKTNTCREIVTYDGAEERKVLTLGEMIMMSRRRSYLKRAVQSRDQYNYSTGL
ncbi:uncharacterized protein [Rutidosis leptorrhynchoides]|uniref:uncharacterized protein n=1 Tax=Rutidosis leptorrhynchoides TaxID=125765 RepID=UPI003A9A1396